MTDSKGNLKSVGNKHLLFSNHSVWEMCQTDLCLSRLSYRLPIFCDSTVTHNTAI